MVEVKKAMGKYVYSEIKPFKKAKKCNGYDETLKRIPSQIEKIINLLKESGEEGATNIALCAISFKYDARLSELRRKGYEIETLYDGKGIFRYVLKKIPADNKFYMNATDEILLWMMKNL